MLAAPVQVAGTTTVAGGLLSVAASGLLTTPSLQVQAGGLATGAAQRVQADTQLAMAPGTRLQLGGDQVLARLVDLGGPGDPGGAAVPARQDEILKIARDNPAAVANVVRSWVGTEAKGA